MGKIVKYCNACEEGFAEKFGFCPNCGDQLTAFEMNPVAAEAKTEPEPRVEEIPEAEVLAAARHDESVIPEPVFVEPVVEEADDEPLLELAPAEPVEEVAEPVVEEPVAAAIPVTEAFVPATVHEATFGRSAHRPIDDSFHVTIVEEKNVKQRNVLLLGTFFLLSFGFVFAFLYSLFSKALDVAALDSPEYVALLNTVEPVPFEEEVEKKKDKDDGGGGGGGGKEEENEANKGRAAAQNPDPMFAPSSRSVPLTNPDIAIQMATKNKNPQEAEKTDQPYGLPQGGDTLSDGTGSGGGLGGGRGRGQGNGQGGGLGNGNGDGRGNGNGDGNGDGTGGGDGEFNTSVVKVGPTLPLKIVSKPRANYTDAARVNNIQGTVILRVTFQANGTIGGVSVVKGLPNGLTEMAISAAKSIRFEPAKKNGQPYPVNKNVEYTFTIF